MSTSNLVPAGQFLCPKCTSTHQDDSYFSVSEFNYGISLGLLDIEKIEADYGVTLPSDFPSTENRSTIPNFDALFGVVESTGRRELYLIRNNSVKIPYGIKKCPSCGAILDIPEFGEVPTGYCGNLGSTSCGKTSLYVAMKDLGTRGAYAGMSISFIAWAPTGRQYELEETEEDLVERTADDPEYRYIFTFRKNNRALAMLIYRDFPGEWLSQTRSAAWAPWLEHMNVLLISIDPIQIKGVEGLLKSLKPSDFDAEWKAAFGNKELVGINVAEQNLRLRTFLGKLEQNTTINWKKTRLQLMITKSNQLKLICRLAEERSLTDWHQEQDGFRIPILSQNSILFQPDHTELNHQYNPNETLAISRIIWDAIYNLDRRLYTLALCPLLDKIIKANPEWSRRRAIAFCSNGLCFKENGKPDYSSSTRALEQMLWTLFELADIK